MAATPLTDSNFVHFRLHSLLGKGGMGEVWLAEDTHLSRKVAIKLLPAKFTIDAGRVRRFAQEARGASALNHPNIITIHEIGEAPAGHGKMHYIVAEHVEGESPHQQMARARQSHQADRSDRPSRTGGRCACRRAQGRDHAPRHQAGERYGAARRDHQGARFRTCKTDGRKHVELALVYIESRHLSSWKRPIRITLAG